MAPAEFATLAAELGADDLAALWQRLPEGRRAVLLAALPEADRATLQALTAWPEGSAGAVMTTEFAALAPELTAAEAIAALRPQAAIAETIEIAYVLGDGRALLGTVTLEALVVAAPERRVADLLAPAAATIRATERAERAARLLARYDLRALPVLAADGPMLGIITADDAMDVAEAAATEDFQKSAGAEPLGVSLADAPVGLLYRKRIGWLVALVFANLVSGAAIAAYEEVIAENFALLFFLPLLIASAGNAGSQAACLMVRALATDDMPLGDLRRMIVREAVVATLLGATMAVAVSLLGLWRGGPEIAAVVAPTMILVVVFASLIGLSLPVLLARFGADPATASTPLITTLADAGGVVMYFTIASLILLS
jgi:magnesium transporter